MRIGCLSHRMVLQKETVLSNSAGVRDSSWADIASISVEMEPVNTDTVVVVSNYNRRLTHKVSLRYRDDVKTGMRLLYGSRAFMIRAVVNDDEKNRFLKLWVEEGGLL